MTDPKSGIDVTPAMRDAGASVIAERWIDLRHPEGDDLFERTAEAVFRSMLDARPE